MNRPHEFRSNASLRTCGRRPRGARQCSSASRRSCTVAAPAAAGADVTRRLAQPAAGRRRAGGRRAGAGGKRRRRGRAERRGPARAARVARRLLAGNGEPARIPRAVAAAARRHADRRGPTACCAGKMQDYEYLRLEARDRRRLFLAVRRRAARRRSGSPARPPTSKDTIFTFANTADDVSGAARLSPRHRGLALRDDRRAAERRRQDGHLPDAARSTAKAASSSRSRAHHVGKRAVRRPRPPAKSAALASFERMLAAGKDSALLRFSIGNEYCEGAATGRRPSTRSAHAVDARSARTRPRGSSTPARSSTPAARRGRARRLSARHRGRAPEGRSAGGEGDDGVRAPHRARARGRPRQLTRLHPIGGLPNSATPRFASSSARWLPGVSAWPLHPVPADPVLRGRARRARATARRSSRACGRSCASRSSSSRGSRSRCRASRTASRGRGRRRNPRASASSARMTAVSSIRLFVVARLAAVELASRGRRRSAARPSRPGPGLPLHAPSV